MNNALLEELLNEDENATLDFKRDQYPFVGASDDQKGELLKDILAMANAWRRTIAYILIGVDEVKGGRSIPVGISQHLNDSELQQFVNSKTQRPVTFAYQGFAFEGLQLGIIEVPIQKRPVFLKKAFGKLAANTVYVRRGSSTDVAQLDEVASMGASDAGSGERQPAFELGWANLYEREAVGPTVAVETIVLTPKLSARSLIPNNGAFGHLGVYQFGSSDEDYYKRLIGYTYKDSLLTAQGFYIRNTSGTAATDVLVRSRIPKIEGVQLYDYDGRPEMPSKHSLLANIRPITQQLQKRPEPAVADFPDHWELTIPFGTVLPKDTVWSAGVIYLGSMESRRIDFAIEVFAANLPAPLSFTLSVDLAVTTRPMTRDDLPYGSMR